jgi:hypothetical protein
MDLEEEGIKAIIWIREQGGVEETEENARTILSEMDYSQKAHLIRTYRLYCKYRKGDNDDKD